MFFRNASAILAVKFLWVGLLFGIASIFLKFFVKLTRKNVYIVNIVCFVFWLTFGLVFSAMCFYFNDYSFSFYGLVSMLAGIIIVKISIEFFFDYFVRFIYNGVSNAKEKRRNGRLQANKKV